VKQRLGAGKHAGGCTGGAESKHDQEICWWESD
jgi:hypothetical protein